MPEQHRPGTRRARARPTVTPVAPPATIGPVAVSGRRATDPEPEQVIFDPALAGVAEPLARELAQLWKARHHNGFASSAHKHRVVLTRLAAALGDAGVSRWDQVTPQVLQDIEHIYRAAGGYGYARVAWDYLRKVGIDSLHGTMPPGTRTFLTAPPNLAPRRTVPTEALPAGMLRDILRAAMHDVLTAENRINNVAWDHCSAPPADALIKGHETVAFFVLLCMEWGQSPDVLKALSFDPAESTSVQDWGGEHPRVTVRWFKHRSRRGSVAVFLADQQWRAGSLLRRLREATVTTRLLAPPAWRDYPWVCVDDDLSTRTIGRMLKDYPDRVITLDHGEPGFVTSIFNAKKTRAGFLPWCLTPRKPGLIIAVPEQFTRARGRDPLHYRAIRPAAKWAKFTATGKGLLLAELVDDNTIEVLSAHYLNSQVALRDISAAWQDVPGIAEEVARGLRPTALDRTGAVVTGSDLPPALADRAREGDLRVGISGCRDPYASPLAGEAAGRFCGAANRSCFFCPNSVVTPDDIPAMKTFLLLAERAVTDLSPPEWALHWGRTVRWICWVLPQMDPDWEALPVADSELFDLGLEAGPA